MTDKPVRTTVSTTKNIGLLDVDGDGFYPTECYGTDCDDYNAAINTNAEEIWYDGIDQDYDGHSDFDQDFDGDILFGYDFMRMELGHSGTWTVMVWLAFRAVRL